MIGALNADTLNSIVLNGPNYYSASTNSVAITFRQIVGVTALSNVAITFRQIVNFRSQSIANDAAITFKQSVHYKSLDNNAITLRQRVFDE